MKNEAVNVAVTVATGTGGVVAALSPQSVAFYQTDLWLGSVAIGGAIVVGLAIVNGIYLLRRNISKDKGI